MKIQLQINRDGLLYSSTETRRVTESQSNGNRADVPNLIADICDDLVAQDWVNGYNGLDTQISIKTVDFNEPPLGAECWCVFAKTGQVYHLPCVKTTDWIWWTNIAPKWFLFINSKSNSKHNFIHRVLTICYKN